MWGKLQFNVLGILATSTIGGLHLYHWCTGQVQVDWFVWLGFTVFLFRIFVECIGDAAQAVLNIQTKRKVQRRIAVDTAMRNWHERR